MRGKRDIGFGVGLGLAVLFGFVATVSASQFSSPSYIIDASVNNTFGGDESSASYNLHGSGGESVIGNGSGGSYKVGMGYITQIPHSMQVSIEPSGLVASYSFEEGSGNSVIDDSINNNNGNFVGSPARVTGQIGSSLGPFDASNYVTIPGTTPFDVTAITACSWVNMTAISSDPVFLSRSPGTPAQDGQWSLAFNASTTPKVIMYGAGTVNVLSSTLGGLTIGTWHQVCMTYDQSTLILYVDGVNAASLSLSAALTGVTDPLRIGCRGSGSVPFNGRVDEVRVYSRVLNADEIKAEYTAQSSGVGSGLTLGTVTPGVSNSLLADTLVKTDAGSYSLAINQNHRLQSGTNTIPAVTGTIASPAAWTEGTTTGLGFSLSATNATPIPGKWGGGGNYAKFPNSPSTFYSRSGHQSTPDYVTLNIRLDVATTQVATVAPYTNTLTMTGTVLP